MRNWISEKKEAEVIRGLRKEFRKRKEYLLTLEESFIGCVFDEDQEDDYEKIYSVFCNAYNNTLYEINQKFNNVCEELNGYFEYSYKPIERIYA